VSARAARVVGLLPTYLAGARGVYVCVFMYVCVCLCLCVCV
jgi:hypothetical protein